MPDLGSEALDFRAASESLPRSEPDRFLRTSKPRFSNRDAWALNKNRPGCSMHSAPARFDQLVMKTPDHMQREGKSRAVHRS